MLKKTLMTAAAALAITAGATTISTPDANAGVKGKFSYGGGYYGGWGYGGHHGYYGSHGHHGGWGYYKKKYYNYKKKH